jgi:hypothetical protein
MGGGFVKRYNAARFSGGTLTGVLEEALEDMVGLSLSGAPAIGAKRLLLEAAFSRRRAFLKAPQVTLFPH